MDTLTIKNLRNIVPIPINEAEKLLSENNNDVERCADLYKKIVLERIVNQTGCNKYTATQIYEEEKFDYNRTISVITELEYDKHYKSVSGISKKSLLFVKDWFYLMEGKDFGTSLAYNHFDEVIKVFKQIPKLTQLAIILEKAQIAYSKIFADYNDSMPMDEFIKRHSLLDASKSFQQANEALRLEIEVIKDEIRRHWRNVNK